jgi:hypothetical protein
MRSSQNDSQYRNSGKTGNRMTGGEPRDESLRVDRLTTDPGREGGMPNVARFIRRRQHLQTPREESRAIRQRCGNAEPSLRYGMLTRGASRRSPRKSSPTKFLSARRVNSTHYFLGPSWSQCRFKDAGSRSRAGNETLNKGFTIPAGGDQCFLSVLGSRMSRHGPQIHKYSLQFSPLVLTHQTRELPDPLDPVHPQ